MTRRANNGVIVCTAFALLMACAKNEPFQAAAWKHTSEMDRHVFVDDLVERQLLIGETAEEVKEMLGPPSSGASQTQISYLVGPGKWFSFDAVTILDVTIGPDRRVVKVSLRGD